MSYVSFLAEKSFKKIFKNIASEFNVPIMDVQLGICYENGSHKYEAYKLNENKSSFEKEKDITLDDYMGGMVMDLTGGSQTIDATIAASLPRFAGELTEKFKRQVDTSEINIVMMYNEKGLPFAVLLCGGEKQRAINIENEFLKK